jgi:hypothetical protein
LEAEIQSRINLFREKTDRLLSSTVRHALQNGEVRFTIRAEAGASVQIEAGGPTLEAVEAFVLNLRFFIQDNESISIRRMAEFIEDLSIPEDVKDRVRKGRANFNAYLDSPCGFGVFGTHPTNREVLEVFVYGSLAHANEEKRRIYDSWARSSLVLGMMNQVFMAVLLEFLKYLGFLVANLESTEGAGASS